MVRDNRYTSAYLFGAICPARGVGAAVITPAANVAAMNVHLAEISTQIAPGAQAVLLLDRAGWHQRGKRLCVPANITLLDLPAYSPELNSMENVWEFLRGNKLSALVGTPTTPSSMPVSVLGTSSSVTQSELPPAFLDTPLSEEPAMVKSSMNEIERTAAAVDGPVVSEGGRSPSTLSPGQSAPATRGGAALGPLGPNQRWSATRKREVVLRLLRGEAAELLSRELGLPLFKLEQWRQKAEGALEGALKERDTDPADSQLAAAMQRIGELSMEVELLRAKMERPGPLARRRSR